MLSTRPKSKLIQIYRSNDPLRIIFLVILLLVSGRAALAQVNVTTHRYDNQRSGVNTNETVLTPQNVNPNSFGKLFSQAVDGYIYAQPLYVANLVIPNKGTHNVVFVATEHDSVYAFDADSNTGPNAEPLWQTSFLSNGVTTVSSLDLNTTDIIPEIGITGTPVIDLSSNTIYVVAETLENGNYLKKLHALDITTGLEKPNFPVLITASVAGKGAGSANGTLNFNVKWQMNRAGLLLYNGVLYTAFGSHEDMDVWHGWVLGYDVTTLQQVFVFCDTPNAYQAGIWMAGEGLPMDFGSNLFLATGNGGFDASSSTCNDCGDSILRIDLSQGPVVQDYFTPSDQNTLDGSDLDLGSGGVLVLPDQAGPNVHLLVQAGKEGNIYLINRDNMGQFSSSSNNVVQEIDGAIGRMWSTPVHFNSKVYFWGADSVLTAFTLTKGMLSTTPTDTGSTLLKFPGAVPVISANGASNGILWALESDGFSKTGPGRPAVLRAYDPNNLSGGELYSSNTNPPRDDPGGAIKFAVPTVTNGKVYVGSEGVLSVFGELTSPAAMPTFAPPAENFTGSLTISMADATTDATIFFTTDGSMPFPGAGTTMPYTGPFTITATTTLKAVAMASGFSNSMIASATYTQLTTTFTTINASPNSSVGGQDLTLTARVTSPAGTPNGNVNFLDGGIEIGAAPLSNGQAVFVTSLLSVGSHSIVAQYSGNSTFAASTSAVLTQMVNVAAFGPSSANVPGVTVGQSVTFAVTMYAAPGSNLSFAMSCSGVPANSSCSFSPNPFSPGPPPNGTPVEVTFSTQAASSLFMWWLRPPEPIELPGFAGLLAMITGFFFWYARSSGRRAWTTAAAAFALAALIVGCSGGSSSRAALTGGTPRGIVNLTLSATSESIKLTETIPINVQ